MSVLSLLLKSVKDGTESMVLEEKERGQTWKVVKGSGNGMGTQT